MSDRYEKNTQNEKGVDSRKAAVKQRLDYLKEELNLQKEQAQEIRDLIKKEIETHYENDLWELSPKELDQEMGKLLTFLNEDIDCTATPEITSQRKFAGGFIVFLKKLIKAIIRPVFELYLGRQRRFNESAVRFQLASFIRLRRMEEKLDGIEKIAKEISEQQEALMDAIGNLSERPGENGPKR
jgi:hypothetical protein